MKIEEIIQLIESVSKNKLDKFTYEKDGEKLHISKSTPEIVHEEKVFDASCITNTKPEEENIIKKEQEVLNINSDNIVLSPLVGTFYKSSSPESKAFVEVGSVVKKGQILGIIEAMKLMNEIESEFDGVVEAILVEDGDIVEYGQALFRIR